MTAGQKSSFIFRTVTFVVVILELSQQCALGSLRQQETQFHKGKFCCSSPAESLALTVITVKCLAASAIGRRAFASRVIMFTRCPSLRVCARAISLTRSPLRFPLCSGSGFVWSLVSVRVSVASRGPSTRRTTTWLVGLRVEPRTSDFAYQSSGQESIVLLSTCSFRL